MVEPVSAVLTLGAGGSVGAIIGFAVKKLAKLVAQIIAVLIGLQLAVFAVFEHYGLITVDWVGVQTALVNVLGVTASASGAAAGAVPTLTDTMLAALPLGGATVGGFLLGFKYA